MSSSRLRPRLQAFRDEHAIAALGAGVVTSDGLRDVDVLGERVRGGGDPVAVEDAWHIGSCGKSMTAALYARLVERGEAEWQVPISELFAYSRDDVDPGWDSVTVDDVFVCQAGMPANLTRAEMLAAYRDTRSLTDQRTEVAARALARPPKHPGRFVYSNLGYIVIGAAIERITGTTYEDALVTHVFDPLGIEAAGFGPPDRVWGQGGRMLALGPVIIGLGRGAPADPREATSDNPAVMSPAGRMHLTLEDWARFQRVFITDGGGFLRPDSIDRLVTPAPGRGQRMSPGWAPVPAGSGASIGQQGSNTFWVATAVVDRERARTAMVVCNDGRARLLRTTPRLALELLRAS